MHVNITAAKRATMCSIVKLKNTSKTILNRIMCVMHANITAIKRATMCSIVKLKNINIILKMSLCRQPK